jgi:MICOS complex subunit MIC12
MHRQNRARQSLMLSQQNQVLTNIVDPQPPIPPPSAREVRAGLLEQAKDKWNTEIEGIVRRIYDTDWNQVRANWEDRIGDIAKRVSAETTEAVSGERSASPVTKVTSREG